MNKQRAAALRRLRQHADRFGIYKMRLLRLRFSAIDCRVCSSIHDHVWLLGLDKSFELVGTSQVGASPITSQQVAKRREGSLQLPTHLPIGPKQKNAH